MTIVNYLAKTDYEVTGNESLLIGFSKTSSALSTIKPTDENLNMVAYKEIGDHQIAKQQFQVVKGDRIYLTMYTDMGSLMSDGRAVITWDPEFVFEKDTATYVKFTEEIAKIALTDEELAASGWDGVTANTAEKEAALKTAFDKSAIKFYAASSAAVSYRQMEYYDYAQDGNSWTMSYTKVNELGAGSAVPNAQNPRFTTNGTHMLYSRDAQYHITWAIGYEAPEDGVITIPAHTLTLNYFTNTDGLFIGFSKGEKTRAKIDPADESLNFVKYTTTGTAATHENKVYKIEEQKFQVLKGEMVYINFYCNPTGSDARASATWDPTFKFEAGAVIEDLPLEVKTSLAQELAKIGYTDEEKTASGWDGTTRDTNKQALYKVAFAKSSLEYYGGSYANSAYNVKPMYDWAWNGNNFRWSYSCVGGLEVGQQPGKDYGIKATGSHKIGTINYENFYAIKWTAPKNGTLTIPAHSVTINASKTVGGGVLQMAYTKGDYLIPGEEGWVSYPETAQIAEQKFEVKAGESVWLSIYCGGDTATAKRIVEMTYDPHFNFVETVDPCAKGHTEEILAAVAPTCTETGLTEGKKCSVCGEIIVAQEVVSTVPHTEEVLEKGKAPTCTESGLTDKIHCSVCGKTYEQEEIPALGHTEETLAAVAPTCTETGLTEGKKCSVCGEILVAQEEVPALGHTEETLAAVEPTCTETGLTEGKKCSVCGEILVAQEEVPALGHTEVVDSAVAPTCTETGLTEGKHCSVCGEVLVAQETVNELGHTWKGATCTEPKTCEVCGETEGEALGHEWQDATCTEPKTCIACGETEGEALGHAYGEWVETVAPSQHEKGERKHTCTACGHTETEEIPATGIDEKASCSSSLTAGSLGLIMFAIATAFVFKKKND